jgi:hypothetical protein
MFFSLFAFLFSSGFTRGGLVTHNLSSLPGLASCGTRTGTVFMFFSPFAFVFVLLRLRTWRARPSQPLFATRTCVFFCNQLGYGRLVIRRAVTLATLGS